MRFRRSGQRLTGLDLIIGEIVRGKTGNSADFLNKRTFEVRLTVKFASDEPPGDWDKGLLDNYIKRTIGLVVHKVLVYEHPDWQIEVKVEGRYTGTG